MMFQENDIKLLHFNTLPSTNKYLRDNIDILEKRTIAVTEIQTEGRGRRGKSWNSDDSMLMFSALLKEAPYPQSAALAAAASIIRVFKRLYGIRAFIKWPNDIIAENRKVCGILCESTVRCDCNGKINVKNRKPDVICGIGINASTEQNFFTENNLPHAVSLKMLCGTDINRSALLEGIIRELYSLLETDFCGYKAEYSESCITLGKEILVNCADGNMQGEAIDITEEGFLICKNNSGGIFTLNSGEVSVRGLYGYV